MVGPDGPGPAGRGRAGRHGGPGVRQTAISKVGRLGFDQPLKIPPLAEPRLDHDGRKVFDLRLQAGTTELTPARLAKTWGVNDAYLGPPCAPPGATAWSST